MLTFLVNFSWLIFSLTTTTVIFLFGWGLTPKSWAVIILGYFSQFMVMLVKVFIDEFIKNSGPR